MSIIVGKRKHGEEWANSGASTAASECGTWMSTFPLCASVHFPLRSMALAYLSGNYAMKDIGAISGSTIRPYARAVRAEERRGLCNATCAIASLEPRTLE